MSFVYMGDPHHPVVPDKCRAAVHDSHGVGFHQCTRNPKQDGWCKQHHPDAVTKRERAKQERYEARRVADKAYWDTREAQEAAYNKLEALGYVWSDGSWVKYD